MFCHTFVSFCIFFQAALNFGDFLRMNVKMGNFVACRLSLAARCVSCVMRGVEIRKKIVR